MNKSRGKVFFLNELKSVCARAWKNVSLLFYQEDQDFVVLTFFALLLIQQSSNIDNVNHTLHRNLSHLYQLLKTRHTKKYTNSLLNQVLDFVIDF